MTGWFEIEVEARRSLLHLTMGGFFDAATVERLRAAIVAALPRLGCPANTHLTLCDITAMSIQSQEMVQRFTALIGSPAVRSHRLAFVTGATLARLQARRLTDREGVAFFDDAGAARDWLLGRCARAA